MTDLFGRTADEIRADIRRAKTINVITASYRGNEGLGLRVERALDRIAVDERQLAMLEKGVDPKLPESWPDSLSGKALADFRKNILSMGRR